MEVWIEITVQISIRPSSQQPGQCFMRARQLKKNKKNNQWLRLNWILPLSRRERGSIPASVHRLCAGAAPESFWSDELCLLISSNGALIKAAGCKELLGGGGPEAATFKSYTMCRADRTSLTSWKSGQTSLCFFLLASSHKHFIYVPPRPPGYVFFSLSVHSNSAPPVWLSKVRSAVTKT